jgi:hypothetical protein
MLPSFFVVIFDVAFDAEFDTAVGALLEVFADTEEPLTN